MQIKRQVTINAAVESVWEVIGPQYAQVEKWISSVHVSNARSSGTVLHQAPCSGRVCETDLGPFKETLTCYDEDNRILAYSAEGAKMPFFVKHMSNTWRVTPLSNSLSKVEMSMEVSMMPVFGWVMGPMMRMRLGQIGTEAVEDLKYFIEQGSPHPRKLEAQQKYNLKFA